MVLQFGTLRSVDAECLFLICFGVWILQALLFAATSPTNPQGCAKTWVWMRKTKTSLEFKDRRLGSSMGTSVHRIRFQTTLLLLITKRGVFLSTFLCSRHSKRCIFMVHFAGWHWFSSKMNRTKRGGKLPHPSCLVHSHFIETSPMLRRLLFWLRSTPAQACTVEKAEENSKVQENKSVYKRECKWAGTNVIVGTKYWAFLSNNLVCPQPKRGRILARTTMNGSTNKRSRQYNSQ